MQNCQYSVVIPVYSGAGTLEELTLRLHMFFTSRNLTYEIVFVHDCGPDRSWDVITHLKSASGARITAVQLTRNFGQHNATICGFMYAQGQFVITMDEDLQHFPEEIIKLIDRQRETQADVVYGRYVNAQHSFFRNVTSNLLKAMLRFGIPRLHPDYTSFRLLRSAIAKETVRMDNSYTFLDGYLSWITADVVSVDVDHARRSYGRSAYSLSALVNHSINIFVTFSLLPIRVLTVLSSVFLFVSTGYAMYLLIRRIVFADLIPGYASTNVILGLGFGSVMFGIGILGEYIYRINQKTTRRPNFIVRQKL